jgi:hypothetical protein
MNKKRLAALAVADVALRTALASPSLEVCSLAARGLRLMALIGQEDPDEPSPEEDISEQEQDIHEREEHANEQGRIRGPFPEMIGDPKIIVLGRVEFQKRVRLAISPCARPCTTHLAVWRELYYRWATLTPIVTGHAARSSTDPLVGVSSHVGSFGGLNPEVSRMAKSHFVSSKPLFMLLHRKPIWHGRI